MTRATAALLRGDIDGALTFNPAAPLAVPVVAFVLLWLAVRYVRVGHTGLPSWVAYPVAVTGVVLIAVWVARLLGAFGGPVPV